MQDLLAARPVLGHPVFDRFDPRLIQDLALGQEDEDVVLARYGFTGDEVVKLLADPILQAEVSALTTELKRAGTMAKIKARLAAEELIGTVLQRVRETRLLSDALDALKVLAKIGDLEPRTDAVGKMTGTIVRVDLNIGQLGFGPALSASAKTTVLSSGASGDVTDVTESPQNLELSGELPPAFAGFTPEPLE